MSDQMLVEPVELTDAELDLVTGGALVNVTAVTAINNVLNNNNVLDNNKVAAAVAVLSGLTGAVA
jgi:hypothetical protein